MLVINGKELRKEEVLKFCGSMNQISGYKRYAFAEGRSKGVEAVDINNGSGLALTVLLDRCLDISSCSFKGINLSYITSNGVVAPQFYDSSGTEWLRSFGGGLLTTCGISYSGAVCEDEGERLGIHGRIGNSPADNICCQSYWEGEQYITRVSGRMHETRLFGENLYLSREIKVITGKDKVFLHDSITNAGYKQSPFMMIYHVNFGFPLLDECSEVHIDSVKCMPNDGEAQRKFDERLIMTKPQHGISENVFFHVMSKDDKVGKASIFNPKLGHKGVGAYVKFNLNELPYLNEWKMMGEGEYVLGLEPSNCRTLGRAHERAAGMLRYIEPGETRDIYLEFGVSEDVDKFNRGDL